MRAKPTTASDFFFQSYRLLFLDRYFTSPKLLLAAMKLSRPWYIAGTVKANMFPKEVVLADPKQRGDWNFRSAALQHITKRPEDRIFAYKWQDTSQVLFLTTYAGPVPTSVSRRISGQGRVDVSAPEVRPHLCQSLISVHVGCGLV